MGVNRVIKLFRPNGKLSDFSNLSLKIVYDFVATLRLNARQESTREATTTSKSYKNKPLSKAH